MKSYVQKNKWRPTLSRILALPLTVGRALWLAVFGAAWVWGLWLVTVATLPLGVSPKTMATYVAAHAPYVRDRAQIATGLETLKELLQQLRTLVDAMLFTQSEQREKVAARDVATADLAQHFDDILGAQWAAEWKTVRRQIAQIARASCPPARPGPAVP